jgi:hypothetical protein
LQEGDHIVHHAGIEQFHPFGRLIGIVQRQNHLLTGQQRVVRGNRLVVKDIKAGAAQVARVQGLDQRLAIDTRVPAGLSGRASSGRPGVADSEEEVRSFGALRRP